MAKEDLILFVFIAIAVGGLMFLADVWNALQQRKKKQSKIQKRLEKRELLVGERAVEEENEPAPKKPKTPYSIISWSCAVYGCPNLRLMPSKYCADHGGLEESENEPTGEL